MTLAQCFLGNYIQQDFSVIQSTCFYLDWVLFVCLFHFFDKCLVCADFWGVNPTPRISLGPKATATKCCIAIARTATCCGPRRGCWAVRCVFGQSALGPKTFSAAPGLAWQRMPSAGGGTRPTQACPSTMVGLFVCFRFDAFR
jgi:hypothetical protein